MIKADFNFGGNPPKEFLFALVYEYECEEYDKLITLGLPRRVDRDGRVNIFPSKVFHLSNKNAQEKRSKILSYIRNMGLSPTIFQQNVREIGKYHYEDVTYMHNVRFSDSLGRLRKELEGLDSRIFERSSDFKELF